MFSIKNFFGKPSSSDFGVALADKLAKRYPPSLQPQGGKRPSVDRLSRILEATYADAQVYQEEKKLGIWGRTRVGHAFKWQLSELGYSDDFASVATEGLLVYMNNKNIGVKPILKGKRHESVKESSGDVKAHHKKHKKTGVVRNDSPTQYSRQSPSARYLELVKQYQEMHDNGEKFLGIPANDTFPGLSLPPQAHKILRLIQETGALRILDYGSGKGQQYEASNVYIPAEKRVFNSIQQYWGVQSIHCYDPSYTPFSNLPSGAFDGVISTDVLEHCPEEDVPWIVDEIFGYARRFVFMNVACYPAKKRLPSGENAHCTIKPKNWWIDIINRVAVSHPGVRYEVWIQWRNDDGSMSEDVVRN